MRRSGSLIGGFFLALMLAGCQTTALDDGVVRTNEPVQAEFTSFGDVFQGLKTVADVEYYASDQAVAEAKNQFRQENYGNSGALILKAVQLEPNDGEARLGLAASSDASTCRTRPTARLFASSARLSLTTTTSAIHICSAATSRRPGRTF